MLLQENSQYFYILVGNFRCRSGWENLDRFQYRFQAIKFVNSVLPSPCETQPYNNTVYKFIWPCSPKHGRKELKDSPSSHKCLARILARHDLVTWYKIRHAGTQVAQWDFQTKGRSRWTGTSCFVLGVPLCKMRPSMCDFVHVIGSCKGPIGVSVWNSIPLSVKLLIRSKFQNKIKELHLDVLLNVKITILAYTEISQLTHKVSKLTKFINNCIFITYVCAHYTVTFFSITLSFSIVNLYLLLLCCKLSLLFVILSL